MWVEWMEKELVDERVPLLEIQQVETTELKKVVPMDLKKDRKSADNLE